jgi:general stress protein CsbA
MGQKCLTVIFISVVVVVKWVAYMLLVILVSEGGVIRLKG